MSQVASGLAAIHAQGILHRDLSSNNVLVTAPGTAKILDLGLSTVAHTLATTSRDSRVAGTVMYMAPEVIQGKGATFESDVFSFGVLLYETLVGRNPFGAENAHAVMYKIVNNKPSPLGEELSGLPSTICEIVSACLQKDPLTRPRDLRPISGELAEAAGMTESGIYPPMLRVSGSEGRDSGRNPYLNRVMISRHADFIGRVKEVKRIYARLNARPAGSISIVGERRIGKSSLLNYICMPENRNTHLDQPASLLMLFVDFQEKSDMTLEAFVRKMMTLADRELKGRIPVPTDARDLGAFKDLVRHLHEAGMRLVILFDEFEIITTNPNFSLEFFAFLRFLANHYDVVYLTSSSQDLQGLCHTKAIADSPFFNIFTTMRLPPFDDEDAKKLIIDPARRAGYDLEPYVEEIVENLAGYFPLFLQIACCAFLEYFEESATKDNPNLEAIRERYCDEAEHHYRYVWESLEERGQTVVVNVIQKKAVPDAMRHVLQELKKRGYVREGRGGDQVFSRTFEEFVREVLGEKKAPSFWQRLVSRRATNP
jgi:hypothetical protein